MTTDIKLNTLIKWTAEDRAKGECPVPAGSDVTVWFDGMYPYRPKHGVAEYDWGEREAHITAYLVHSMPRESIVRWLIVGGEYNGLVREVKENAEEVVTQYGGRVVKLVEEME